MKIGIGIDTGGTYTDTVIFDYESRAILGTAKALTTKDDLSIGILNAIDALPGELLKSVEIVSLSTTLATNACVEDKGGNAKLIFFGGNIETINDYGNNYGLPTADEMLIQESYTKFSGELEREPNWGLFQANIENGFNDLDAVGIIETNALRNSAVVEKKAKELFQKKYGIPVVCAHELFNELNCLQRASSTLLNARLIPVIHEFLEAIKTAMTKRNINASVIIVRSDGSLMSDKFANVRPVETLLCGPAASVMGSAWLTCETNSVVIDMGGTTTDIAIINKGLPLKAANGVGIGKWKTFVNGLYIKTFGLGGDTAIHYNNKNVFLEDYRVIPLCVAAEKYPYIAENLKNLTDNVFKHTRYLHEHYILIKDITNSTRYTDEEKMFCDALKNGPLILREAAASIPRKDIYNLNVSRLLKEGIVQICGLTPTDIMHIKGDFNKFPSEASYLGAQFVASNLGISVKTLCDNIYDEIKRKLYINIVKALLETKNSQYIKKTISNDIESFINESYEMAKNGINNEFISMTFKTDFTLTGIGAPIRLFLEDVAKMLGTKAVIPKHYEVANALGAIVGNVYASKTVEIKPNYDASGITGYTVFGYTEIKIFDTIEEAEAFAVLEAKNSAYAEAVNRGARGEITISCKLNRNEAKAKNCTVHLSTQATAQAVGSIGLCL